MRPLRPSRRLPLLLALLALAGCKARIALEVESEPSGANVFVNDALVGRTPTGVLILELPKDDPTAAITLEKLDWKPLTMLITFARPHDTEEAARADVNRYRLTLQPRPQ